MIDNIEIYKEHILKFENKGDFFYCNILLRKKDMNTDKANHQSVRVIKDYCFYSIEDLDRRYDEIKKLAEVFKARVYLGVNRLNDSQVTIRMIKLLAERIESGNNNCRSLWASTVGTLSAQGEKRWIIDIDEESLYLTNEIRQHIDLLEPFGNKIICETPTKSGIHLITRPFRLDQYLYLKFTDVQKLNPSVLYIPDSLLNQK
ncbi:MAG: hypothetical protein IPP05_22085 [Cytophagaceae bacterium]|nr:hypothetical protein [Cytophagaceae bacterium]